jgi:hypothetical protein
VGVGLVDKVKGKAKGKVCCFRPCCALIVGVGLVDKVKGKAKGKVCCFRPCCALIVGVGLVDKVKGKAKGKTCFVVVKWWCCLDVEVLFKVCSTRPRRRARACLIRPRKCWEEAETLLLKPKPLLPRPLPPKPLLPKPLLLKQRPLLLKQRPLLPKPLLLKLLLLLQASLPTWLPSSPSSSSGSPLRTNSNKIKTRTQEFYFPYFHDTNAITGIAQNADADATKQVAMKHAGPKQRFCASACDP